MNARKLDTICHLPRVDLAGDAHLDSGDLLVAGAGVGYLVIAVRRVRSETHPNRWRVIAQRVRPDDHPDAPRHYQWARR